jgi:hypothetical protein
MEVHSIFAHAKSHFFNFPRLPCCTACDDAPFFDSLQVFQTWFNFDEELADAQGGVNRIVAQEEEGRVISKLHAILDPFLLRR